MNLKNYSNIILRLGLGIVFLFFGIGKLRQDVWFHTIKNMQVFGFFGGGIEYFIYLIGLVEILIALFLIIGKYIRFFSALAALHILVILILIKFGEIRDVGLLAMAVYLALMGDKPQQA
jgi:uncharacterized membrane protein YphA (DoxX/SURF4 family)